MKGSGRNEASQQGLIVTQPNAIPKFEFLQAHDTLNHDGQVGLDLGLGEYKDGPMAMSYEPDVGWVANKLGPTSGHWKRRARVGPDDEMKDELGPIQRKREGSLTLSEIDQNIKGTKRRKGEGLGKENAGEDFIKDGRVEVATRKHRRAK